MLNREELVAHFDRLGTPRAGRELIIKARTQAPVRQVQSKGGNVITYLASQKMGCQIGTESRHIEFPGAIDHEFDPQVLEYYAQPCELKLEFIDDSTGDIRDIRHIPDFLVIREDGFTLEEWKSEVKLQRLADKYPYRYQRDADGHWFAPQIEHQLGELGIRYRICTDASIPGKRVENLLHLADYFHPGAEPCPENELTRLHAALKEQGAVYLHDLMNVPLNFSSDFLLKAIADHRVVADLDRELLTSPRCARLYRDATLREFMAGEVVSTGLPGLSNFALVIEAGTRFQYGQDIHTISLVNEARVVFTNKNDKATNLPRQWIIEAHAKGEIRILDGPEGTPSNFASFSEEELKTALHRYALLCAAERSNVSDRTRRRWRTDQVAAVSNGANEVLALVPRTRAKGNRTSRLSEIQSGLMEQVFCEHWSNHRAPTLVACHLHLQEACNRAGVKTPSIVTFSAYIKTRETRHDVKMRWGNRMAYQQSPFVDVLYADTPPHGSRPFQYVHIDHTQLDIELISGRTGMSLGRPWLSLAVDAWSRRIVGFYLSFDPPSYHAGMMVIRDMVKRFNRLPEFVVVDNGRDFMSSAFESFLQVMGTHLRFRPAGQPRHGAVLERMFGKLHSEYIHNLAGNTKVMKNVRMTTGKHQPKHFAEWTLANMYGGIQYWATEYYDTATHGALDMSPREAFQKGLKESGTRPQRYIQMNRDFLISTCPSVDRKGLRTVNHQRGVKVNGLLYWAPEFSDPRIAGHDLSVRYDPWDASSVYVRHKDVWIHAICRNLLGLGQLNEIERRTLTEEYTHKSGNKPDHDTSAQRLREFLSTFTPEGAMDKLMQQQSENKALYNLLHLGPITPVSPLKKHSLKQVNNLPADTQQVVRSSSQRSVAPLPEAATPTPPLNFDTF